ncbi:MAG: hypothetical protein ACR2I0_06015 [Rhodoferax sp.]
MAVGLLVLGASAAAAPPGLAPAAPVYPTSPADEAMQIGANAASFLSCNCLFLEGGTPQRCASDLPTGMASIPLDVDSQLKQVSVRLGRWSALARYLGPGRGCQLSDANASKVGP